MNTIEKKTLVNVRYLCGSPDIAKNRYENLKQTLKDPDLYGIFAEPIFIPETKTFIWATNFNGNPVKYSKLTEQDKALAKKILRERISQILRKTKSYQDEKLTEFVSNCLEIPSLNNIFLIKQSDNQQVILTEWGFVSDQPGSERGLLAKIIEVKKTDVIIKTVFSDNKEPASNVNAFVSIDKEQPQKFTSDKDGVIFLEKIPVDSLLKVKVIDDNQEKEYEFFVYENGNYTVEVSRKLTAIFIIKTQKGDILPNEKLNFVLNKEEKTLLSDNQGVIKIKNLYPQTKITVLHKDKDNKTDYQNSFTIEKNNSEFLIELPIKEYVMKIKVVNPQGEIVKNATVTVKYNGKKETYQTDENGFVYIKNIEPGTEVKVLAKAKKQKK